ncbi:carbohydrate ABC transporter permease [Micromonospora olivasterospora]|uniref:Multiple sugar transport system permease protein n=1 Tax=Micromonospora olivasterospora TaxID=1880 RepID=A0A562III8_MICOL|nr:sugar ABC transporter permease [Micromonospora olivasterospora]TWH70535.1 multiple sugar transport system permease protein [Micromonospora olivasterospora]
MTTSAAALRQRRRRDRNWHPYALIAPAAILVLVFLLYPVASVFYYALQNYNVTLPIYNGFAGLDNFRAIAEDPLFWDSLAFTGRWVLVEVGLQFVCGLVLALLINQSFAGRAVVRALVFSPWAVAGILTTTIWMLIYNPSTGAGYYLAEMGLGSYGTSPLSGTTSTFWAVVLAELWRGAPFFAILILADLQSVPNDLYEAADVDGAGRLRKFVSITWPHIRRAVVIAALLRGVWEFNNVDLLYTLTGGGPGHATTTLPLYVAQTAIHKHDFGYGSALTVVAFLILAAVTVLYLRMTRLGREDT